MYVIFKGITLNAVDQRCLKWMFRLSTDCDAAYDQYYSLKVFLG